MRSVYLVTGIRTPIGRYGGSLSSVRPDDLGAHVIRELMARLPSVPAAAIDDDTVRVHVGANQDYELELFGPCQDVDWAERIAIRATGGSNWICRDIDAELIVPSAIGPSQCQVSGLRKVSDAELAAERAARERD